MAISKNKKRDIVAKLTDAFKEASAVAFVGFSKLTVKDASRVRKELADAGVRYYVAKKTLLRLVLKQQGYEGQAPELPGEVAVAWLGGLERHGGGHGGGGDGAIVQGRLAGRGRDDGPAASRGAGDRVPGGDSRKCR